MRTIVLSLSLLLMMTWLIPVKATLPSGPLPVNGSTLFFDDFLTSGFPSQWNSARPLDNSNFTQQGGFLAAIMPRGAINQSPGGYHVQMLANSTEPVISGTTNQSFTQIAYKTVAFNLTNVSILSQNNGGTPSNDWIVADLRIGLASGFTDAQGNTTGIYFDLMEGTVPLSKICGSATMKQAIYLSVNGGPAGGSTSLRNCVVSGALGTRDGLLYNNGNSPLDLNAMHVFTIQVNKNITDTSQEWVRFQVDNNGWETFFQSACNCLGSTYNSANLFPFIVLSYEVYNVPGSCPCLFIASQTVASFTDWVFVTNYVPASLPSGQILGCQAVLTCNIPARLPQPGITGSITDLLRFEANGIAPGNIYAGGMMLTAIISGVIFAVLFGVSKRLNIPVKSYGLFFTIFVLGLSFLGFWASILPIWAPVMMVLITFGIAFGVIRTGNASGGLVPD